MKRAINVIFCIIYGLILVQILFAYGRVRVWSDLSFQEYAVRTSNFIPFSTIVNYITALKNHTMNVSIPIKNIGGNLVLFMPYAYFVYYFKHPNLKTFIIVSFGLLFMIEIMQLFLRVGTFDVDDIILNLMGAILIYVVLRKGNVSYIK
ncbi:MAG: VanZ family protein [Lachnospiraceae bacterium]|nr:VanZ family protein [Lachnospiraceae bacterium]